MLNRINKTVQHEIKLKNGFVQISVRYNEDCTNRWRENPKITCWIYKNGNKFDSDIIHKMEFDNYRDFKIFKDILINNAK